MTENLNPFSFGTSQHTAWQSGRNAADSEVEKLRAALDFYADQSSYEGRHAGVFDDRGKLAREALEESRCARK